MRQLRIEQSITNHESDSMGYYLNDIGKIELISIQEEVALTKKIKAGDETALDKLVKSNLRFVVSIAKKYQGYGISLGDLVNEGNIGLIKAARSFDETRGFKFISYAVWWIRQGILIAISDQIRTIRVPMNQVLAIQKIRTAMASMEQRMEREATPEELAEELDMSLDHVINHIFNDIPTRYLDDPLGEEGGLVLGGLIRDPNMNHPDQGVMHDSINRETERLLSVLPDRSRSILRELYGLGGEHPKCIESVALAHNLSQERIKQIRKDSFKALRKQIPERLREYI